MNQNKEFSKHREKLGVIIPAYNEEKVIDAFLRELDSVLNQLDLDCTIIIIDDGSTDSTVEIVRKTRTNTPITLIRFARNFGKEIAMSAGLNAANDLDAVVIMDADGQHPPKMLPIFVNYWHQGYDDVYGIRESRQTDKWVKRRLTLLFYKLAEKLSDCIVVNSGDFRLISSPMIKALNQLTEKKRFMKGLYNWVGFNKKGVPYEPRARRDGETKFSSGALIRFAVTGITSFSIIPLKLIIRLGFIVSAFSLFYGLFIFFRTLIFGADLPGWATLSVGITFLSGIQLISIGMLGEYIGEIFIESKRRPLYLIKETLHLNRNTENSEA
jgi:polyisoprenyl-phosphate glycosyltransferase